MGDLARTLAYALGLDAVVGSEDEVLTWRKAGL